MEKSNAVDIAPDVGAIQKQALTNALRTLQDDENGVYDISNIRRKLSLAFFKEQGYEGDWYLYTRIVRREENKYYSVQKRLIVIDAIIQECKLLLSNVNLSWKDRVFPMRVTALHKRSLQYIIKELTQLRNELS